MAQKRKLLDQEQIEKFLFDGSSDDDDLSDLSSSDSSDASEIEEEIFEEESDNDLEENIQTALDSGDDDDINIASAPANAPANKIAPIAVDYNTLAWANDSPQSGMQRHQFVGTPCINPNIKSSEPIDNFEHFFTNKLIEHIAKYTILFAQQCIADKETKGKTKRRSRENSWSDVTANEIFVYTAILIYRGLI